MISLIKCIMIYLGIMLCPSLPLSTLMVANDRVNEVASRLENANHLPAFKVIISYSPVINAWFNGRNVHITKKLLDMIKNDDELALIIGHELGHNVAGPDETKADIYGAHYEKNTGYNVCIGRDIMLRMGKVLGEPSKGDTHPRWEIRYKNISDVGDC